MQYNSFAYYYDILNDSVDYNVLVQHILNIFNRNSIQPDIVLDLACGTGNITIKMAEKGYNMIGIDISTDMLNVAKEKTSNQTDVLFLQQDITGFELYGTVDAILCLTDSINYIVDENELRNLFKLVENYLNPKGLFIFDINSKYKLSNIIGQDTYVFDRDNVFCAWENYYDEIENICEFYLTLFVKEKEKYIRIDETHYERAYEINELLNIINTTKLKIVGIYDDLSFEKPNKKTERIFFVLKKI